MDTSIRKRLITAFICFAVIPLFGMGILYLWHDFDTNIKQIKRFQLELTKHVAEEIEFILSEQEQKIISFLDALDILNKSIEEQNEILSRLLFSLLYRNHRFAMDEIFLLDQDGNTRTQVSRTEILPGLETKDLSNLDEFLIPFKKNTVYCSPVSFDPVSGEPGMTIGIPLANLRTGKVEGVIVSRFRLMFLRDLVSGLRVGEYGTAYITDQAGAVVVHPDPSVVFRKTMVSVPKAPTLMRGIKGNRALVVSARISDAEHPLSFVTEFPLTEVLAGQIHSVVIILLIISATLAVSSLLGFVLMRRIILPIEDLSNVAAAISRGEFSRRAEIRGRDELANLGESFNLMTERLLETIRNFESEKNFVRNVIESISYPFYVIDAQDHTIKLANSACNFGGLHEKKTCHQMTHDSVTPCAGGEHPCPMQLIKRDKKPVVVEHLHRNANGDEFVTEVHGYPIFDPQGEVVQIIEYNLDVTEKKRLEAQLIQAQKMESIGTLAGGIAHDFNNILHAILGYCQMARHQSDDPRTLLSYFDEVYRAGSRAQKLVNQILTFSRKSASEKKPISLARVLKEAVRMLRATIPATIEIQQNILTDGLVDADPNQLHQVIVNLCTNAYHAMRETGGVLAITLMEAESPKDLPAGSMPPGRALLLEVSDTGCGIDPATADKIFEPYFTTKAAGEGTGLGLAVVHGIIREHRGTITVDSKVGHGTIFRVSLPITTAEPEKVVILPPEKPLPGGTERILLVDDEKNNLLIASQALTAFGYQVTTCGIGRQALDEFSSNPDRYDLVITDMIMPQMNGMQLATKLLEIRPGLPVILCTGFSELISREQALEQGCADFLMKPFSTRSLLLATRKALDSHPHAPERPAASPEAGQ